MARFSKDEDDEEEAEEDKQHKEGKCGCINYISIKQKEITCLSIHQIN